MMKFKSYEQEEFIQCKRMLSDTIQNRRRGKNQSSKNVNSKYNSETNEENKDQVIINDEYVPECPFNFIFDYSNRSYKPVYDIKKENENALNDVLKFQALKKINICKGYLQSKKETRMNTKILSKSDSEESENEEKDSSCQSSDSKSNSHYSMNYKEESPKIHKYSSLKLKRNEHKNSISSIKESYSENVKNKQAPVKNDIFSSIYKVNLSKIHFSVYDFNKDMPVDNNEEKISKVEKIIKNTKSRLSVEIKNIDEYPNILFTNVIEEKKKRFFVEK